MNINPVRAIILAVVAVVGVVVIANGFSGPSSVAAATVTPVSPSPAVSTPASPAESPGSQGSSSTSSQKPDMTGVVIQVFNATTTSGLATDWQKKLQKKISAQPAAPDPVGNASPDQSTTTVYYVDKSDKALAEELQKKFFSQGSTAYQGKDGSGLPTLTNATASAPATISKDTQLIIVLGADAAS